MATKKPSGLKKNTPVTLTDTRIRALKPREAPYKLFDQACRGLHLLVTPGGSRLWRFRYWFGKKERLLGIGVYPATSLAKARSHVAEARKQLAASVDPVVARRVEKAEREAAKCTFRSVALEWLATAGTGWTAGHRDRVKRRLEKELFPWLGDRPIGEVTAPELLATLRRIEAGGRNETAHRCHQFASNIYRYAIATGKATGNPATAISGALQPVKATHRAAVTRPADVGALMRAIDASKGTLVVNCALKLLAYTFVRPGELRKAEWSEFDLDGATWRIPAARMKGKREHIVPLSSQAVAVLRELQPLTGSGRYVFPSVRTGARPMSENTLNAALRRLGYSKEEMTGHGFRSVASTLLNELGHRPDVIERQLAHVEKDNVRAAYHRAEYLDERRAMMQAWADYLDGLKAGGKVVALNSRRKGR